MLDFLHSNDRDLGSTLHQSKVKQLTERNLPGDIGQTGSRLGDVTFISLSLPDNTETDLLSIQHNSLQC